MRLKNKNPKKYFSKLYFIQCSYYCIDSEWWSFFFFISQLGNWVFFFIATCSKNVDLCIWLRGRGNSLPPTCTYYPRNIQVKRLYLGCSSLFCISLPHSQFSVSSLGCPDSSTSKKKKKKKSLFTVALLSWHPNEVNIFVSGIVVLPWG